MVTRNDHAQARYICAWCRQADTSLSWFRTPIEGLAPIGEGAHVVCSPACPARPKDAVCFRRPYNGPPSTRQAA